MGYFKSCEVRTVSQEPPKPTYFVEHLRKKHHISSLRKLYTYRDRESNCQIKKSNAKLKYHLKQRKQQERHCAKVTDTNEDLKLRSVAAEIHNRLFILR